MRALLVLAAVLMALGGAYIEAREDARAHDCVRSDKSEGGR